MANKRGGKSKEQLIEAQISEWKALGIEHDVKSRRTQVREMRISSKGRELSSEEASMEQAHKKLGARQTIVDGD